MMVIEHALTSRARVPLIDRMMRRNCQHFLGVAVNRTGRVKAHYVDDPAQHRAAERRWAAKSAVFSSEIGEGNCALGFAFHLAVASSGAFCFQIAST